jgi:hypothetical protein
VLEIANGRQTQGWARFAHISQSPNFNAKWEFAFYAMLLDTHNQEILRSSPTQRGNYEQKAIAAQKRIEAPPWAIQPFDLFDIARVQVERGALNEARKTILLVKSQLRRDLIARKTNKDSIYGWPARVSNGLLSLATIERDAGFNDSITLAQAKNLWPYEPCGFARRLVRLKFYDEAASFFKENQSNDPIGWTVIGAGHIARDKGIEAAMEWFKNTKRVQSRALVLVNIALAITPSSDEEAELILKGAKKNLSVNNRLEILYEPFFALEPLLLRE